MLALPLLTRELRAIARAPGTYRLRLLVGAVAVGILWVAMIDQGAGLNRGGHLFEQIHIAAFITLMILTPLLTADTISKEKREGTLDLLYLTSLSAAKVVTAKFATQFIRIVSIWALLIPLSIVPLLSGGVSLGDVMFALSVEFSIILLSLVAGLFASVMTKRAVAALFLAVGLSIALWLLDVFLVALFLDNRAAKGPPKEILIGLNLILIALLTPLFLALIARIMSRDKSTEGPSRRALWFREVFLKPKFWRSRFQRTMNRRMDGNPLIWLEYRTAWSRVGRSTMVGALIFCESLIIMVNPDGLPEFHRDAALVLLGLLAVTASISFQREKENGAFELLLVAPFTEISLIAGRLRAVWSYYAPVWLTFALLVATTVSQGFEWYVTDRYSSYADLSYNRSAGAVVSLILSVISIPIVGLYFALRLKFFLPTLIMSAFLGFAVPSFLWDVTGAVLEFVAAQTEDSIWILPLVEPFRHETFPYISAAMALHTLIAVTFVFAIHHRLKARVFA
jgi:hypothetical protein